MIDMPFDDMLQKVMQSSGLTKAEVEEKISNKMKALSGLVSKEGALHIIANELGIKLFEDLSGKLKINKILSGMRSLETVGKVLQVFPVREFQTENRSGKVANFLIGDETGTIRVVAWGSMADQASLLKPEQIIQIRSAYVRENQGRKEIHLNDRSELIIEPAGESIGEVKTADSVLRKNISDLNENDSGIEVLGTVVQIFEPRFFELCPECNKKVRLIGPDSVCDTHGKIAPVNSYVTNLVLDDGTETIRVVCFKNITNDLLRKKEEDILPLRQDSEKLKDLQSTVLGTIVKFSGRIIRNKFFDRIEFIANKVDSAPDPEAEIRRLNEELSTLEETVE